MIFWILKKRLTVCNVVKSKGKISQNFMAFSEYMNFKKRLTQENCTGVSKEVVVCDRYD